MEDAYILELTLDEVNYVLKVLSRQPFEEVYSLIHKIHQQAGAQQPVQEDGAEENS